MSDIVRSYNPTPTKSPMASSRSNPTHLLTIFFLLSPTASLIPDLELPSSKATHLHLYLHDVMTGPNSTKITVAGPNTTSPSFGDIIVYDIPLREGPAPASEHLGQAQGSSTRASRDGPAVLLTENFVFTAGEHSGSTIAMMGRVDFAAEGWELTVVGGSGRFRRARGYALGRTVVTDSESGVRVMEYHVYLSEESCGMG